MAWDREGTANPNEYLTRLILQNICFSDEIKLEAAINCRGKMRVLTSQPHIIGGPAPSQAIQDWFIGLGAVRIDSNDRIAWYFREINILVADAHEGNVLLTPNGELIPIDLNIMEPKGAWLEFLQSSSGA